MDAPQYKPPAPDPAFAALMAQSKQQDAAAAGVRMTADTNSLTARYGTLTAGDNASILARYAAQLQLAGSGGAALGSLSGGIGGSS